MSLKFESFDPTMSVTWRFQGQVISSTTMNYVIKSVTQEHAGIYECYRSKEDGMEDSTYRSVDKYSVMFVKKEIGGGNDTSGNCQGPAKKGLALRKHQSSAR